MLNIPSYISDQSYRYKMPILQTAFEGKGNGVKTYFPNLSDVARHLQVPTDYLLRFFVFQYGCIGDYKKKEDRATITGNFRQGDLQEKLDKFIQKFVLCPRCHLPEIQITVKQNKLVSNCKACGNRAPMEMSHKISAYIVKHPPPTKNLGKNPGQKRKGGKAVQVEKVKTSKKKMSIHSQVIKECVQRIIEFKGEMINHLKNQVTNVILSSNLETEFKLYVILKALFGDELVESIQNEDYMKIVKNYTQECYDEFLVAFGSIYGGNPEFQSWVPTALKYFYDYDVLSDQVLIGWKNGNIEYMSMLKVFEAEKMAALKNAAIPFLEWIENAEDSSEESDEEEEEKEEEMVPEKTQEDRQKEIVQKQIEEQQVVAPVVEEPAGPSIDLLGQLDDEDDDFDIDNI